MEHEQGLELREVTKRFPGVLALSKVNLSLAPGEVVGLLGENGAGKSTLMKVLTGVYQADGGAIYLDGQQVRLEGPRHARELGIGIIFQDLTLVMKQKAAKP